jgi:hypothetical protein
MKSDCIVSELRVEVCKIGWIYYFTAICPRTGQRGPSAWSFHDAIELWKINCS